MEQMARRQAELGSQQEKLAGIDNYYDISARLREIALVDWFTG